MKKKIFIVIVLLALGGGGWYGYHHFKQAKPATAPDIAYVPSTQNPPVATNTVTIHNYAFSPGDIKVKVGSTVTWTNQDLVAYTVVEDDGQTGPSSSGIPKNQIYIFKFTKVGLFHYHDSLDPNITGTVTVTE